MRSEAANCSFHIADSSDLCLYLHLVTLGRLAHMLRPTHALTQAGLVRQ